MRKIIIFALLALALTAMLLCPGAARSGTRDREQHDLSTPETFDPLSTEKQQELQEQMDSLHRAFRMDTLSRPKGNLLRDRIILRKHEPDGDWMMTRARP